MPTENTFIPEVPPDTSAPNVASEKANQPASEKPTETTKPTVKKGKPPLLIASIVVLAIVILATAGLYVMNYFASAELESTRASVAEIDSKIATLRADSDVHAMEILNSNRNFVNSEIDASKAQVIITKLMELKKAYGVDFAGFSFAGKKVSTVVSVPADPNDREPANKLVKFISDFRNHTGSASGSLLEMGDIASVSGDNSSRTFSIEFIVK